MFITLKLLDMKRKTREGPAPRSIYHSNNWREWSSSPPTRHSNLLPSTSLIFLKALFICCLTSLAFYSYTHTHTASIYPSFGEMVIDVWVRVWNVLVQKHPTPFSEQNTEKPVPAAIHGCVFLMYIHTASNELITTDHFLMVGYRVLVHVTGFLAT